MGYLIMKKSIICILACALLLGFYAFTNLADVKTNKISPVSKNDIVESNPTTTNDITEPTLPIIVNNVEITKVIGGIAANASRWMPSTVDELLKKTDIVVIGEFIGIGNGELEYLDDPDFFEKPVVSYGSTTKQLKVLEVFYGDVEVGDVIPIWQDYYFDAENGELLNFSILAPMHEGDRYIHLLSYYEPFKAYYNVATEAGRYPLPCAEMLKLAASIQEELAIMAEAAVAISEGRSVRYSDDELVMVGDILRKAVLESKFDFYDLGIYPGSESERFVKCGFPWGFYFNVLKRFEVKAYDWVNPGREIDKQLVDMILRQREAYRKQLDENG